MNIKKIIGIAAVAACVCSMSCITVSAEKEDNDNILIEDDAGSDNSLDTSDSDSDLDASDILGEDIIGGEDEDVDIYTPDDTDTAFEDELGTTSEGDNILTDTNAADDTNVVVDITPDTTISDVGNVTVTPETGTPSTGDAGVFPEIASVILSGAAIALKLKK